MKRITINGEYAGFTTEAQGTVKFVCRGDKCQYQLSAQVGNESAKCPLGHTNDIAWEDEK